SASAAQESFRLAELSLRKADHPQQEQGTVEIGVELERALHGLRCPRKIISDEVTDRQAVRDLGKIGRQARSLFERVDCRLLVAEFLLVSAQSQPIGRALRIELGGEP